MESRVNYTIVGLFVIVLGIGLGSAALWLSTRGHAKNYTSYLIYMNEAASGLNEQAPVKFNGVQVGYIDKIALNPRDPQQVKLTLQIDTNTPISTNTVATLVSQGITGITHVGLKATSVTGEPLTTKAGEDYPIIAYQPSIFVEIDTAIRDISARFKNISEQLSKIFDDNNGAALSETLTNLQAVTRTLASNNQRIDNTLRNANQLLINLSESSEQLPDATKRFRSAMQQVDAASQRFNATMKKAEATVQSISQETLPVANEMLQHFERTANNLEQLSAELNQNPSMLIRGRQPPLPGPGE